MKLTKTVDKRLSSGFINYNSPVNRVFTSIQRSPLGMAFCAPPNPNCGFIEHGCALYGGLQIRTDVPTNAKPFDFYIPQFNLALHWQKPFLVPHSIGFPNVLTRPLDWSSSTVVPYRPPGQWDFDTPEDVLRNRNLLTGALNEHCGGDMVRLWSVNELSDRRCLMEFRVKKREGEDGFEGDWEVTEGNEQRSRDEIEEMHSLEASGLSASGFAAPSSSQGYRYGDRTPATRRSRRLLSRLSGSPSSQLLTTCRTGPDNSASRISPRDQYQSGPVCCIDLPSPALQLLAWPQTGRNAHVLIRTENSLCLWDSEKKEISRLYSLYVRYVSPMPYMDEELLVMDQGRLVWYGGMEQGSVKLTRVKCVGDVQLVCPSDHPRLIYVGDTENVWMVDLRDGTSHGSTLYSIPEFDDTSGCGQYYCYENAFPKPKLRHICFLNRRPRMLLITTSNKFCLIDERMPGVRYIEQSHSIADGGDYVLSAPPFLDPEHNGYVYPFYVIRNITLADVQQISFYEHTSGRHWSSLGHVKRLAEPADIGRFLDEQRKYGIRISKGQRRRLFGDGPTRAIHVQDGVTYRDRKDRHILFRMLSDGSIWYEETGVEDDHQSEDEALRRSIERVRRMVDEVKDARGPVWEDSVDSSLMRQPESLTEHCNIEAPLRSTGSDDETMGDIEGQLDNPLRTIVNTDYPQSEPRLQFDDSDHIFSGCDINACGFRGSMSSAAPSVYGDLFEDVEEALKETIEVTPKWCIYDSAHISQTFVALCSLLILGDDLSGVDRKAVLLGVSSCQLEDGSFRGQRETENGMRFAYCAATICYILDDFSAINMQKLLDFIRRSINYDGGIGEGPSLESHGGSTFCAVASLAMCGHLWDESVLSFRQLEKLKKWALWKQTEGFHGRANKPDDSCYAFWIGATLKMLDAHSLIDGATLRSFLLSAQDDRTGGFSKYPGSYSDALHTYFSIAALSLLGEPTLRVMFPPIISTARAHERLMRLRRLPDRL